MQCRNHPYRNAEHMCVSCKTPLCSDCAEEVRPGVFSCFQCAMLQSVSRGGTTLEDKQRVAAQKAKKARRRWGPFHFFVTISSVLIVVMWGIIFFGGQKPPEQAGTVSKDGRVLLFMVDGALKRYAKYQKNTYPEELDELVPTYLPFRESDLSHLSKLVYIREPNRGYRLWLAKPKKGESQVVLSPQGIEYMASPGSLS